MTQDYRFIGKATLRKDAVEIANGRAKFINDMKLPHMLYGKVLRSPYPHANIKSIDTSKAKELRGVKAVLTYKDIPATIICIIINSCCIWKIQRTCNSC